MANAYSGSRLAIRLAADGSVEEVARIVDQIRLRWPKVRIVLHADSGFARDELMAWCEANDVHFVFGLAKNDRLIAEIKVELGATEKMSRRTGNRRSVSSNSSARHARAGARGASSPRQNG